MTPYESDRFSGTHFNLSKTDDQRRGILSGERFCRSAAAFFSGRLELGRAPYLVMVGYFIIPVCQKPK